MTRIAFEIGDAAVAPGERARLAIPVSELYTHTPVTLPVYVMHGRRHGPVVFVSGAVHGDEINGVEIIRRLVRLPLLDRLRGTLIAVPIVNVFGFENRSRYLPDRRDLNRSLPGSETGSLAGRLGHAFFDTVVRQATLGIDLHTAAQHRDNLPQIRADLENPQLLELASVFGTPVMVHSGFIEGSLRKAAADHGIAVMVYEAGEALRFDEMSIRIGVRGIVHVLRAMEMLPTRKQPKLRRPTLLRSTTWVRAGNSGILRATVRLGAAVRRNDLLGLIADPFGETETRVVAPASGVVIGRTNLPLVYGGEALFHIGRTQNADAIQQRIGAMQSAIEEPAPELPEEPPIV
ncbi:MAG: succinylglutamate desuccinylase/aspartoacylase family protein [Chromatiales bacterium]|nr:succinylglutamate desuccinylase/aspartoacylase family protein [Chromatiales bacterium]